MTEMQSARTSISFEPFASRPSAASQNQGGRHEVNRSPRDSLRDAEAPASVSAFSFPKSINIVPMVMDFGGQSEPRLQALARAADRVMASVHGGMRYAQCLSTADFAMLKEFVVFAESEFALASAGAVRDNKPDAQKSRDGYSHFTDLEKL
jgi:hypothetical protein